MNCCDAAPDRAVFCPTCGRVIGDRLRTIGFVGAGVLSERLRDFWESGDPALIPRRSGKVASRLPERELRPDSSVPPAVG
jgi:hypothetical protein